MDSREDIETKYRLQPDQYLSVFENYDEKYRYQELWNLAKGYDAHVSDVEDIKIVDHATMYRGNVTPETCDKYRDHFFSDFIRKKDDYEAVKPLIQSVLTPELDSAIKRYFGTNYCVAWYCATTVAGPDTPTSYTNKWHCDAGPSMHLKTITYFDNSSDHGSATSIADIESTDKLKSIGYALNDKKKRQNDISDLTAQYDINFKPQRNEFSKGDTLVFNPTQRLHKIDLPDTEQARHSFTLCLVPAPLPWNELVQLGFKPIEGNPAFEPIAQDILRIVKGKLKFDNNSIIEIDEKGTINGADSLLHHLEIMFNDDVYVERIYSNILNSCGDTISFTVNELLVKMKESFHNNLNWKGAFCAGDIAHLKNIIEFEENYIMSISRYSDVAKPIPEAIRWPCPNHSKYPSNKFNLLPYVNKHPCIDSQTVIASAGSCFAFEVARYLQENDFNYLVEERADDPSEGVIIDGYKAGQKYAKFSANYGLLFNTPSLRQLAEKAFDQREFTRYLCKIDNYFMDPYRENVFFTSQEAYKNDYDKHIQAIRRSLLNCEVFVFTAGLNECWQLPDSSVISRNPRNGFYHLIKHRVLTVQENVDNIRSFVELVRQHNPKFKLILSLSPIPLLATGRGEKHHIIEANTHSKAVLRVAIDQAVNEIENVYYLPSYELVTECTENAWEDDHRHVTRETVVKVMEMFKEIFVLS